MEVPNKRSSVGPGDTTNAGDGVEDDGERMENVNDVKLVLKQVGVKLQPVQEELVELYVQHKQYEGDHAKHETTGLKSSTLKQVTIHVEKIIPRDKDSTASQQDRKYVGSTKTAFAVERTQQYDDDDVVVLLLCSTQQHIGFSGR